MEAARTLNFGHVQVNDHLMVTSEMPHGGFKQSGTGKDMSTYSFEEYTQVKHVMLELTGEPEKGWHYTIFGDKPAVNRPFAPQLAGPGRARRSARAAGRSALEMGPADVVGRVLVLASSGRLTSMNADGSTPSGC